jgi:DNA-binding NtrC family response regulator
MRALPPARPRSHAVDAPSQNKPNFVLLAEDETLIALSLEDELADAGFIVAGPFATCTPALTWLDENTPDVALLDVKLADGLCIEVARMLVRRGIPLAVFSGGMFPLVRAEFRDVPWFEKPADYVDIVRTLHELVDGRGSRNRSLTGSPNAPSRQG